MLLPLFLPISLKFHLVEIDAFLKIPFVVKSNFVFLTFGISILKASTAGSFSIFLQDKYVTNVISITTITERIYTIGKISVLKTGTSKFVNRIWKVFHILDYYFFYAIINLSLIIGGLNLWAQTK